MGGYKMIEEFEWRWPNKCFICAMYRYGRDNLQDKSVPPPHICKESPINKGFYE